jgi:hypothetical protein
MWPQVYPSAPHRSFQPPFFGFQQGNDVRRFSEPIRDASGHCRRHTQRAADLDEVVCEVVQRNRSSVVLNLTTESVRQTRVAPDRHSDAEILSLCKAGRNVRWIHPSCLEAAELKWSLEVLRALWLETVNLAGETYKPRFDL